MRAKKHIVVVGVSFVLLLVSLTQDGYYVAGPNPTAWSPGFGLFLVGWLGLFYGVVAWIANPLIFLAYAFALRRNYSWALASGLFATGFALSFLLLKTIVVSEATTSAAIIGYGHGYWIWLSAMVSMTIGSLGLLLASQSSNRP